jgi:ectoine hydroxylase-related dioxygenase (phytanoyl-CoA dioxygenase family)
VHQIISEVFTPKAEVILDQYRPLVSNFTVKEPGADSFFDFHLDWNMVDEAQYRSVTIWCPLTDTNAENGNLWILEASHTLGNSYRCGPGLELFFEEPDAVQRKKFIKKALPMKAGQAIIYDHKLFHGSPPNMSREVRIAINQAMCPKEAPAMHYATVGGGDIMAFEVDDDFFCRVMIDRLDLDKPAKLIHRPHEKGIPQESINALIH